MRARPDFSDFVVHFTKDAAPISGAKHAEAVKDIFPLRAKERLIGILSSKHIRATHMPWTDRVAVCFTECTWVSLFEHARQYSRYGVGFKKETLFRQGGSPAIYMTPTLLNQQRTFVGPGKEPFDDEVFSFITPFAPRYMGKVYNNAHWKNKPIDYTHEREWRVPRTFTFSLEEVAFVIVDTYEDMASAPKELKDAIGRDDWLIMANWERVEELWPTHRMPD